ncbi:MAG: ABC transporter substrate-binding protein [Alphaproteobacteria bacterium]
MASRYYGFVLAALALVLAVGQAGAEPLRIGHSTWVTYGPFYVALEKGYFAEEGIEVELVNIEDDNLRAGALASGELDAMGIRVDQVPLLLKPDAGMRYLFAVGESRGADGLLADRGIETIAGLKGKRVAFADGSSMHFYINVLLAGAGLSQSDIEPVELTPGSAGHAFLKGEVDAALTWEPLLTRGKKNGRLLANTAKSPGLITDIIVARPGVADQRRKEFRALYRAWLKAVNFVRRNPKDSPAIMAAGVGRWLKAPEVFADMRKGTAYYNAKMNKAYFGTGKKPGRLFKTVQTAIDIWSGLGRMQVRTEAGELIDYGIVNR